jgi:cell wall-associated NlpC family hydrolase
MKLATYVYIHIGFMLLVHHTAWAGPSAYQAIVSVPVADLIGQPFSDKHAREQIEQKYHAIPFDGTASSGVCARLHQLLLHEQVTVIDQKGDEVCILVSHIFFITNTSKEKQTMYWTLKKNITPLSTLQKHKVDMALLPAPITFGKKQTAQHQRTISLAYPYTSDEIDNTFSAGTRFISTGNGDDASIEVYALNPQTLQLAKITLPKQLCVEHKEQSHDGHIALYLQILKAWTQKSNGFIPYVWGGCSFDTLHTSDAFTQQTGTGNSYWFERSTTTSPGPLRGVDCAGLVALAAQTAGIPYFYKNTTTLAHFLKPVNDIHQLRNGDLMWIPGHVMIVSDIQKNLMIEARCYKHGFGKVHEIKLSKIFKGIPTFARLMQALKNNEPLQRLHKNGSIVQSVQKYKLLSIASAWDFTTENSL